MNHGDNAERAAAPAPNLHWQGHEKERWRDLVEVGNVLEHGNVVFTQCNVAFELGRLAEIDARRVDSHGLDSALLDKPSSGLGLEPREMQFTYALTAGSLRAEVGLSIGPVRAKSGPQQNDHIDQGAVVLGFPASQIVNGDLVVRVIRAAGTCVDDNRRSNKSIELDLVNGMAVLKKMNRRIQVCPTVFCGVKTVGRIEVPLLGDTRRATLQHESFFGGPIDGVFVERVRKID